MCFSQCQICTARATHLRHTHARQRHAACAFARAQAIRTSTALTAGSGPAAAAAPAGAASASPSGAPLSSALMMASSLRTCAVRRGAVRPRCAEVSRRGARSRGPGDSGGASSATPLGGRGLKRALRYGQRVMPNSLHRCLSTVTQTPSCGGAGGARKACVGCEGLRRFSHCNAAAHLHSNFVDRLVEIAGQLIERERPRRICGSALLRNRCEKAARCFHKEMAAACAAPTRFRAGGNAEGTRLAHVAAPVACRASRTSRCGPTGAPKRPPP